MPQAGQPIPLDFSRSSTPGSLPGEGEGQLVNAFLEKLGDKYLFRRCAGLATIGDASAYDTPRGLFEFGGYLYGAMSDAIVYWPVAGGTPTVLTNSYQIGTGSDFVTFARNLKQPTADIVAARADGGAVVVDFSTDTVLAYPDADLPATVNSVASLSAYLIFSDPTDNKIWASQVNSTDVDALSYATAESAPGELIRVIHSGNAIFALCADRIEPWVDVGSSPFPLRRHTTVIDAGLLEFGAVAGSQTGWDHSILFVAHDGTVRSLNGYNPVKVSTPDVERFIADSTPGTFDAQVFTDRGQAIWSLTTDQGTWQYFLSNNSWVERQSEGAAWRATATVKAAHQWFALDRSSGALLTISADTMQDVDATLPFIAQSAPLKDFPLRASIPAVHLDFTRGNGGTVDFSYSLDGGRNFSDWETFSLGSTGEDDGPIIINRLGQASTHGLIARVRVEDAVAFAFMGAAVPVGARTR